MANLPLDAVHTAAEMGCRGKLGGWIIQGALPLNANYYTRAGVPLLIKLATAQPDPKTEKQQAQRLLVGHATRDWQSASQAEKLRAADIARRRNLPLFHAYLSLRIKELQAMPTIDDIPGLREALDALMGGLTALQIEFSGDADNPVTPRISIGGVETGITYGTRQGRMTRVGRLALFSFRIDLTSKAGLTGQIRVLGPSNVALLPDGPPILGAGSLIQTSQNKLVGLTVQKGLNASAFSLLKQETNAIALLDGADLADTDQLRGSIAYVVG